MDADHPMENSEIRVYSLISATAILTSTEDAQHGCNVHDFSK